MNFTRLLLALNKVSKVKLAMLVTIIIVFKIDSIYNYTGIYGSLSHYFSNFGLSKVQDERPYYHTEFYTELIRLTHHDNLKLVILYEFVPPGDEIDYIGKKLLTWYSKDGAFNLDTIKKLGADFMPIRSNPAQVESLLKNTIHIENLLVDSEEKELNTKWHLKYLIAESVTFLVHVPIVDDKGRTFSYMTLGFDGVPEDMKDLMVEVTNVSKRIKKPLYTQIQLDKRA